MRETDQGKAEICFETSPEKLQKAIGILSHMVGGESERILRQQKRVWRIVNGFIFNALFLLIVFPVIFAPQGALTWWILYFFVLAFLLGVLVNNPPLNITIQTITYNSLGAWGKVEVLLDEEGFQTKQHGTFSLTSWDVYHGVEEKKGLILFLRDPVGADFVPVEAFESEGSKDYFISVAREYIKSTRGGATFNR